MAVNREIAETVLGAEIGDPSDKVSAQRPIPVFARDVIDALASDKKFSGKKSSSTYRKQYP